MNLFRIQNELISDRTADAWYQTRISGPFFHYRWSWGSGPGGDFSDVIGEHHGHAVCREEPSLTVQWGMDVDHDDARGRQFAWAQDFPNPSVRLFWVDFFWNNALIDRVELCSIDGGHGYIPVPDHHMHVTDYEAAVAHLVHDLSGGPEHDNPARYLDTLGITRVRDEDRWGAGSEHEGASP